MVVQEALEKREASGPSRWSLTPSTRVRSRESLGGTVRITRLAPACRYLVRALRVRNTPVDSTTTGGPRGPVHGLW